MVSGTNRVVQRPWSVRIQRSTATAALGFFGSQGGIQEERGGNGRARRVLFITGQKIRDTRENQGAQSGKGRSCHLDFRDAIK